MTACPTIPISRGAYYSGTKQPGCTIVFTGAGSYDTDSYFGINTLRWRWDFDYNGTFTIDITTTNAYPTWTYSQAGAYTVAVQFIDDDGQCGAIYTFQITISGLKRLYYVKDHLGSIRVTVDSTGNIVSYDDYDRACPPIFLAEGMQLDGRSTNYGSANEKYKFTGKERDVETGYDYFGARYYDGRIGRWMSVDPLAEKYPGLSAYNYVLNNPIKSLDPNGEGVWEAITGFGSGFAKGVYGIITSPVTTVQTVAALANDPAGTTAAIASGLQEKYNTLTNMSSSNDFARSEVIGEITATVAAAIATAGIVKTNETTAITHYTNDVGKNAISESGSLRSGTFVTKPGEIPKGSTAMQAEKTLEIGKGKGEFSIDVKTKKSNLKIPENGSTTSGGAWQRQTKKEIKINPKDFKETEK